MKMIQIDLSSFSSEKQAELKKKITSLSWDDYVTIRQPELITVAWHHKEPIEEVFPELASHLTYL